jgi:hypothetical protein
MMRHVASKEDEDILEMKGVFGYLISFGKKVMDHHRTPFAMLSFHI